MFQRLKGVRVAALLLLATACSPCLGDIPPNLFHETFDGGTIDSNLWVTGGRHRGWNTSNPSDTGSWTYSTSVTAATDGYFEARVQGPMTGYTYGAESWIKSTQDFNDGNAYVINFTWDASTVGGDNYALYHFQLTDGTIPDTNTVHWTLSGLTGTYDLLKQRDDNNNLHCGAFFPNGQAKTTWSMVIDPAGIGLLYDNPDGSGTLLGQESLDPSTSWHFRMMVVGATSYGFPAKDTSFNLYDVSVTPEPATLSLLVLGGLAMLRHRRK